MVAWAIVSRPLSLGPESNPARLSKMDMGLWLSPWRALGKGLNAPEWMGEVRAITGRGGMGGYALGANSR